MVIIDLILFILLFPTQELIFIVLSIIFWITLIITFGAFLVITVRSLIEKKYRNGLITSAQSKSDKKFMAWMMVILLIVFSIFGFFIYIMFIPDFKAIINEGYIHETVNEIIKGKTTNQEKIGALLGWFDQNSSNMYNSWTLNDQGKLVWDVPFSYILIFSKSPYICIRCFEDNDARWILTSRCGACGEYSRLFMVMVDALGYDVKRIHAPGEDHVWNEVKIDGKWIPVDPTDVVLPRKDGWKNYDFMEKKEGNVSHVWAEYLHNDTIEDITSLYTNLTNVTIHAVDQNNNSLSDVTITIISHNLKRDPNHETSILGQSKPKTNELGCCTFQIGGGNYTLKAESQDNMLIGELRGIRFKDDILRHNFTIVLDKKNS